MGTPYLKETFVKYLSINGEKGLSAEPGLVVGAGHMVATRQRLLSYRMEPAWLNV